MIAVLFSIYGPYILARMSAVSKLASTPILGIEGGAISAVYQWEQIDSDCGFDRIRLFPNSSLETQKAAEIKSRLFAVLDEVSPHIVFVPGWSSTAALAATDWCIQNGRPSVLMSASTAHDEPRRWWREAIKRRVLALGSAALVGGSPQKEYVTALGMAPERVFTGYDVVDNRHFFAGADAARQLASDERDRLGLPSAFFLASNRFIKKKNLPRLLKAYDSYRQHAGLKAWHLVLLGDGPMRGAVEEIIRARNLGQWVHLPGFKQYDELPAYYGLASAFVHASTSEQWGLVVNEAMAAGLPVLVSNRCGCASDLVADDKNGYCFDPMDVEELAEAMLRLASDDCDRVAMGQCSLDIISAWTPSIFAQAVVAAAEVAWAAPRPITHWWDRALLWALMHR